MTTEEKTKLKQSLIDNILKIEKEMNTTIDQTDSEQVLYAINIRVELLGITAQMMEAATVLYELAKGEFAEVAMENEKILNAKADIQRKWFEGKLSEWSGLYVRTERVTKNLQHNIDGLISILSYNKELLKNKL